MNKVIPLLAFSVLFLSINVNQAMAGVVFDVFFDVDVESFAGDPVAGAACTISDPGSGIIVSGFTDANGEFSATISQVMAGDVFDVECTKGSVGASQSVTIGSSQTETVSLTLPQLVGGESLSLDTTALLLAAAQSPLGWLSALAIATLGIGAYVFTRNPTNVRNIKAILGNYLDRL